MEYNQYWNEIKGVDNDIEKCEDKTSEDVVSFDYSAVSEEPANNNVENDVLLNNNIFAEDEDEVADESSEEDDSMMYSNSSLFDMIDEIEEREEAEKEERLNDSRFINFDFNDDVAEDSEKDVHIFADDISDDDFEESEPIAESKPEYVAEPQVEEECIAEPEPKYAAEPQIEAEPQVEEEYAAESKPVVEPEPEPVAEPQVEEEYAAESKPVAEPQVVEETVEEIPHYESPVFEEKEETDIDKLILEAKRIEEESSQRKLMDDSELLPLLKDIISFMPANCGFVDYVLKLGNEDRKELVRFIDQAKNAWIKDKSDKLFTIAEGELSICILSDISDPMREVQRLETIGAQMFSYDCASWNVVKLYFDGEGKLLRADTQLISKENFNSWQWKIVQNAGYNLWKSRQ